MITHHVKTSPESAELGETSLTYTQTCSFCNRSTMARSGMLQYTAIFLLVLSNAHAFLVSPSTLSFAGQIAVSTSRARCSVLARRNTVTMMSGSPGKLIAVSSGKGMTGVALGSMIVAGIKKKDLSVTAIEPLLRRASSAAQECSVDDMYGQDQLIYDNQFLAMHAASGMRVVMGCPMHVLHGVKGGCDACKCRMPTMDEVKRYCPYYGSSATVEARMAWEMREKLDKLLEKTSTLVIVSASEDISAPDDRPALQQMLLQQMALVDVATHSKVGSVLLVGPSTAAPDGAKSQMNKQMKDFEVVSSMHSQQSQFEGMVVEGIDIATDLEKKLRPLRLEKYLQQVGMTYRVLRAPYVNMNSKAVAESVVQEVLYPGSDKVVILRELPEIAMTPKARYYVEGGGI